MESSEKISSQQLIVFCEKILEKIEVPPRMSYL
jgi:hypothetical protein